METRETFVVTLFYDPRRSAEPRGRLRHIASNREATFKNLEELIHLLCRFVGKPGETTNQNVEVKDE
ncbi:MAG: hypothetical protein DRI79_09765 [Chloroflexi bacterium]|nr:MAG: hypothetical protein DRI79_09765 [Chloroflexota bacterium]